MSGFEILKIGNKKYVEYITDNELVDEMILGMIINNMIPGIARPSFTQIDDKIVIKYDITSMEPADELLKATGNIEIYINVLGGIAKALSNIENYMLDVECLLFDMQHIYYNIYTQDAFMIVVPNNVSTVNVRDFIIETLEEYNFENSRKSSEILGRALTFLKSNEEIDGEKLSFWVESMKQIVKGNYTSTKKGTPYFIYKKTGEKVLIETDHFIIGRRNDMSDYAIESAKYLSKVHAEICIEDGVFYLRDNDSSNHTYLNGDRFLRGEKRVLVNGDEFRLASEDFIFGIDENVVPSDKKQESIINKVDDAPIEDKIGQENKGDNEEKSIVPVSSEERITLYELLSKYNPERAARYKKQKAMDKEIKRQQKKAHASKTNGKQIEKKDNNYLIPKKKNN